MAWGKQVVTKEQVERAWARCTRELWLEHRGHYMQAVEQAKSLEQKYMNQEVGVEDE